MLKYFKKFFSLSTDRKWLLAEAVLFIFSAKILLVLLPVKTVMKISLSSDGRINDSDPCILSEIKWSLYYADRLSTWKNRCLVQSIAGRWMLQRRGIPARLSFGISHDSSKKVLAHAWLKSGDFELVEKTEGYRELYTV